ncbi:aminopeptidase N-like [Haemaphysalis longicornis]
MSLRLESERRQRPQSSYTVDTPTWDAKSRCCGSRTIPYVGNRNGTIALVAFVVAVFIVMGTFAFVHNGSRAMHETTVLEETPPTTNPVSDFVVRARHQPRPPAATAARRAVSHATTGARPREEGTKRTAKNLTEAPLKEQAAPAALPRSSEGRRETTTPGASHSLPEAETVIKRRSGPARPPSLRPVEDAGEVEGPMALLPLPGTLVPEHYSVLVHPHSEGEHLVFTGVVKIRARCLESTRRVTLHAANLQVNSAKVMFNVMVANRSAVHEIPVRRVETNSSGQQMTLTLSNSLHAQMTYDISISYAGVVTPSPRGLYKAAYTLRDGTKRWMAFTRLKPRYARRVFPCFDDPSYRATFDLEILRRKDFSSISSMPILKVEISSHKDYENDVFVRTPPIPTYLLGFAITDFAPIGKGSVKVWSEPSSHLRSEFALQTASRCLDLYEKYFQTPYPLPKLDIIISPTGGDTYESEGLVFIPSTSLASKLTLDSRKEIEANIYRCILKQWIGGIVSFDSWREFWLDQALEDYIIFAVTRLEKTKSAEDDDKFALKMQRVLSLDASERLPPVSGGDPALGSSFGVRKTKGELLLHMFDSVLRDDAIRTVLQELLVKRKHQTITEEDFWEELSNANNESFPRGAQVARAWTHSAGFPLVTVTRVYGQRTVLVRQQKYGDNTSKTVWSIPITYTDGQRMDFDNTANAFWLTKREAKLPIAPKDDDWFVANLRGCGYYRVNYDTRNWNLVTMELNTYHTNIDTLNRARILDDLFELADLSIVPYGTALHASEYLRREKDTLPWRTVLKRWEYLEAMLGSGSALEKWKLFIIRLLVHHVHSFKWSYTQEDGDARFLRVMHYEWACKYKYAPCVIEARHAFESYMSALPNAKPILPELQLTVFCTVIEDGGEEEWQSLYTRLGRVSNNAERRSIILSLGCTKDHDRLVRYFEEFSAPGHKMVPLIFTEAVKRGKLGRRATTEYVLANWHDLKTRYPGHFEDILTSVFKHIPVYEELSRVNKLLRRHRSSLLRYDAAFREIDRAAKKNIAWVAAHYAEVSRWLKRDVAEFILDDQVLHGNSALNGTVGSAEINDTDGVDVFATSDDVTSYPAEYGSGSRVNSSVYNSVQRIPDELSATSGNSSDLNLRADSDADQNTSLPIRVVSEHKSVTNESSGVENRPVLSSSTSEAAIDYLAGGRSTGRDYGETSPEYPSDDVFNGPDNGVWVFGKRSAGEFGDDILVDSDNYHSKVSKGTYVSGNIDAALTTEKMQGVTAAAAELNTEQNLKLRKAITEQSGGGEREAPYAKEQLTAEVATSKDAVSGEAAYNSRTERDDESRKEGAREKFVIAVNAIRASNVSRAADFTEVARGTQELAGTANGNQKNSEALIAADLAATTNLTQGTGLNLNHSAGTASNAALDDSAAKTASVKLVAEQRVGTA